MPKPEDLLLLFLSIFVSLVAIIQVISIRSAEQVAMIFIATTFIWQFFRLTTFLYRDLKDHYHHRQSIQSRRLRYSLFRQKVKSEPVEFENEAKKVIK